MDYGVLYAYIKAVIFDESEFAMDIVDSLKYNKEDFFNNIQSDLKLENKSSEDISIVNLFCICGSKEKILQISNNIQKEILERILISYELKNSYKSQDMYTEFLNTYVLYLLNNNMSPLSFLYDIDENLSILYFFGSNIFHQHPPKDIEVILDIWISREYPYLLGKQIITQPFYYKNLIGRKALDIASSFDSDDLYLLLEGNIKIKLNYDSISPYNYLDTNRFNENDIQRILYDPIYCFGYSFESQILYLEWFDIYLYTIALLDINLNDEDKLKQSYSAFLKFIEQNICNKVYTNETILNESDFYKYLKIHLKRMRAFLQRKRGIKYF